MKTTVSMPSMDLILASIDAKSAGAVDGLRYAITRIPFFHDSSRALVFRINSENALTIRMEKAIVRMVTVLRNRLSKISLIAFLIKIRMASMFDAFVKKSKSAFFRSAFRLHTAVPKSYNPSSGSFNQQPVMRCNYQRPAPVVKFL